LLTIFSSSREVRELSLSRRDDPLEKPPPAGTPLAGTDSHPVAHPYYPPAEPGKVPPKDAAPKGSNLKSYAFNFVVGTAATMAGLSILNAITGPSRSAPATSSTTSTSSPSSGYQNPQSYSNPGPQYQYQNQQRSVDHGKRADFFGEPHSSHGL
jgi:hypothetical protein